MTMRVFGVYAALVAALSFAQAQTMKINANVKDGDKISGEFKFRVTVDAKNLVTQVEFYVGEDLRDTDSSTPYEFVLDTLGEKDGPIKVSFAAYTAEGENTKKVFNLTIDNGLDKGADFHVQKGLDAVTQSKWDDAIAEGRIALKIKPGYNPARLLMARANLGKGILDVAQKFVEDASATEPNNPQVLDLLAGINLRKAFATYNRSATQDDNAKLETLKNISNAIQSAITARRKVLDATIDTFGAVNDGNRMKYVTTAINAGRYSLAINELSTLFRKDQRNNAVADALAYAQIRASKTKDAIMTLENNRKQAGSLDGYGFALMAILNEINGKDLEAADMEREAVVSDGENLGVRTTQAFLALRRNKKDVLARLASELGRDEGARPEVGYYLSTAYYQMGDFEMSRTWFERTLLAEPTMVDMFVERGNQAIALALSGSITEKKEIEYQYLVAQVFFESALTAKPDSVEALTGQAITFLMQNKASEALKSARAAVAARPEYAAGQYALGSALDAYSKLVLKTRTNENGAQVDAQVAKLNADALKASENAGKLDRPNLEGRSIPATVVAWKYYMRYGRTPLITAPK